VQGIYHMEDEVAAGNVNHIISGVGQEPVNVARYLEGFEGRSPMYTDTQTGAGVTIDRSRPSGIPSVVIHKSWQIHAFHAPEGYITRKIDLGVWG
jgi:tricorn protease-like protein